MPDALTERLGFTIGRVVKLAFVVMFRNVLVVLLVAILGYGSQYVLNIEVGPALGKLLPMSFSARSTASYYSFGILDLPCLAFVHGSLAYLAFGRLAGHRVRIGETLRTGARALVPVAAVSLVITVGTSLAGLLLIVPGFVLYLRWYVAVPVVVNEAPGFLPSLSRSAHLTFGLVAAFGVLGTLVFIGRTLLTMSVFSWPASIRSLAFVVVPIISTLVGVLIGAFSAIIQGVSYAELRRVKEGGLSQQLAAVFE